MIINNKENVCLRIRSLGKKGTLKTLANFIKIYFYCFDWIKKGLGTLHWDLRAVPRLYPYRHETSEHCKYVP